MFPRKKHQCSFSLAVRLHFLPLLRLGAGEPDSRRVMGVVLALIRRD